MAQSLVDDGIKGSAGNRVFMISKTYCPFCVDAKKALKSAGYTDADMQIEELDSNPDANAIQGYCQKITGGRTVPRVWVDAKFIGGGDDTCAAVKNGTVKK